MSQVALLHGNVFECNIPTVGEKGFPFEKLILWSTVREKLSAGELLAVKLLGQCLDLDPANRISAKDALKEDFLREDMVLNDGDDEIEMIDN